MSQPVADQHHLPPWRVSLMLLLVFATLGSILGSVAAGDNTLRFDIVVLEAIQAFEVPGIETVVTISNAVFGTVGALALAALFIVVALLLRRPAFILQLVIVIVLRLAGQVLKPIFASPRPGLAYQPDPSLVSSSMGYPSGHAYTATVITTMLVLFIHALDVPRWVRASSIVIAVLLTLIALVSRIRIGAHWPTDTIGGVCYGIATIALMQLVVGWIDRRSRL